VRQVARIANRLPFQALGFCMDLIHPSAVSQGYDRIAYAYVRANHFQVLDVALLWDRAAGELILRDPAAARLALEHAIRAYEAYRQAYAEHMPASRWDYDYGPELSAAERRSSAIGPLLQPDPRLPSWMLSVLQGRYERALAEFTGLTSFPGETALLAVLARVCRIARLDEEAMRLESCAEPVRDE
jgi:hypothetical protein